MKEICDQCNVKKIINSKWEYNKNLLLKCPRPRPIKTHTIVKLLKERNCYFYVQFSVQFSVIK